VNGLECDNCRVFNSMPAVGWLVLFQQLDPTAGLGPLQAPAATIGSFCSYRCVGEYAYVRATAGESQQS
jgi:hypothetical protein